ncbi:long-chain fatty acid--CoA ligase [Micromonospora sp. WMMD1128]|uniref:long-chain-fatty-acid--CoA ligase n=1 Tax=Micromonospora sp. WMMD1128 TaxID=3015150 RepID=UPI00248C2EF6|nr:long-chain fatty acid--CoA ligase [Micromonospora sp. WMMD1128]WBB77069.1 long-chain fatty acid--CoA ligase [Micromonospora sp. WMMD1128]
MSVAAILAESAARGPRRTALVTEDEEVSYGDLWQRALRAAGTLKARGVRPGDAVTVMLENTPDLPVACFAIWAAGATVVPVATSARPAEVEYTLTDSGSVLLICAEALIAEAGQAARAARVPALTEVELVGTAPPLNTYEPRRPDDIAIILYTSGTTGRPKGAMLTHLNVTMNIMVTRVSPFDVTADDVLLGALPLYHSFGLICGLGTCLLAGASVVLMRRFDAARALDLIEKHGCTLFMGVPTMFTTMLAAMAPGDAGRYRLDRVFSGGAPLHVATLEAIRAAFGCEVYEGYGLTEASPCVAYNQKWWPTKPGTVGRPIWGVDVRVADADRADTVAFVPDGEVGEIVVRGHNIMAGYLNLPEATAGTVVDGWLRTGDLGRFDEDGYLTIVDRKKDVILRGGHNVYPREIEEVLSRHSAVRQVAVVGLPDDRLGEEVCAAVVVRDGFSAGPELAAELVALARDRLAGYKCPRRVEFLPSFPLGGGGKVLKRELAVHLA